MTWGKRYYMSGKTNMPLHWETAKGEGYQNPWVGASSLYFAAPAFAARSDYEALLWLSLALISCWSDCETCCVSMACCLKQWGIMSHGMARHNTARHDTARHSRHVTSLA